MRIVEPPILDPEDAGSSDITDPPSDESGVCRVLVSDAGRGSGLAFIRSLGRRGWWVLAGDHRGDSPGMHSRFIAGRLRYPDPRIDHAATAGRIIAAAHRYRLDLIIPVTDEILLPLAAQRTELPVRCRLAAAADSQLRATVDKVVTLGLARQVGVRIPATRLVRTVDDGLRAGRNLGWPVVVKPRRSRALSPRGGVDSFSVDYADDPRSLVRGLAPLVGRVDVLIQEYVPGDGVGVGVLADAGRPIAMLAHRRLHEVPITGGASSLRETIPLTTELRTPVERLVRRLQWTGLAMVEFRYGREGPVLMEINGRVWGSLPLAVAAGVDFPGLVGDVYAGKEPTALVHDYRVGVRARNLELDVVWLLSVLRGKRAAQGVPIPPRRAALGGILELLDPRVRDDILEMRDPLPGLALAARIAAKLGRKAFS